MCTVIAGSRIAARGIVNPCRSSSFTRVAALVTPAAPLNSPPAIVVGTLIWRTPGGASGGATPFTTRMLSIARDRADFVGEAKLHRLGAIGDRAAADGDDEIGVRGTRRFAG